VIKLTLALLLSAPWNDSSGRLRCEIPDGFIATSANRFALGDERLVFLPLIPRANSPSAWEVAARLLRALGLPAPAGADTAALITGNGLVASVSILATDAGWTGALVIGLPGDFGVQTRATQAAASCHVGAAAPAPARGDQ
jgi:hypothetical protein